MLSSISSGGLNAEAEAEESTSFQNALLVHLAPSLFNPFSLLETESIISKQIEYELFWVFPIMELLELYWVF